MATCGLPCGKSGCDEPCSQPPGHEDGDCSCTGYGAVPTEVDDRVDPYTEKVSDHVSVSHHDGIAPYIIPDRRGNLPKSVFIPTTCGPRSVAMDDYLIALKVIERIEAGDTSIQVEVCRCPMSGTSAKAIGTRVTES